MFFQGGSSNRPFYYLIEQTLIFPETLFSPRTHTNFPGGSFFSLNRYSFSRKPYLVLKHLRFSRFIIGKKFFKKRQEFYTPVTQQRLLIKISQGTNLKIFQDFQAEKLTNIVFNYNPQHTLSQHKHRPSFLHCLLFFYGFSCRLHPPENLLSLSENRDFHSFSPLNILRGELTAFA